MGEDDFSWLLGGGLEGGDIGPEAGSFIGPDGTDVNGMSPGDYNDLFTQAGQGLDDQGRDVTDPNFNWASPAGQAIMSMAGGSGGSAGGSSGGGIDWSKILPLLLGGAATVAGGVINRNAVRTATGQTTEAIRQANDKITGILGGTNAVFSPYTDMGKVGAAGMQATPASNMSSRFGPIAQNFGPLGTGRPPNPITLGTLLGKR